MIDKRYREAFWRYREIWAETCALDDDAFDGKEPAIAIAQAIEHTRRLLPAAIECLAAAEAAGLHDEWADWAEMCRELTEELHWLEVHNANP